MVLMSGRKDSYEEKSEFPLKDLCYYTDLIILYYANQTHPTGKSVASLGSELEMLLGSSMVWCSPLIITRCW